MSLIKKLAQGILAGALALAPITYAHGKDWDEWERSEWKKHLWIEANQNQFPQYMACIRAYVKDADKNIKNDAEDSGERDLAFKDKTGAIYLFKSGCKAFGEGAGFAYRDEKTGSSYLFTSGYNLEQMVKTSYNEKFLSVETVNKPKQREKKYYDVKFAIFLKNGQNFTLDYSNICYLNDGNDLVIFKLPREYTGTQPKFQKADKNNGSLIALGYPSEMDAIQRGDRLILDVVPGSSYTMGKVENKNSRVNYSPNTVSSPNDNLATVSGFDLLPYELPGFSGGPILNERGEIAAMVSGRELFSKGEKGRNLIAPINLIEEGIEKIAERSSARDSETTANSIGEDCMKIELPEKDNKDFSLRATINYSRQR